MVSVGPVVSVPGGGGVTMTWRVTITVREALPPLESVAAMVIVFNPMASGIFTASQFVPVTAAGPNAPVLSHHVTVAPPLPPVTVPESEMDVAVVVGAGAVTVSASGDTTTLWRVTVTEWETLPLVSEAVTVMEFNPSASVIFATVQVEPVTTAAPYRPVLEDQVTWAPPLPPVTVPDSGIEVAVVTDGGVFTVSASVVGGTTAPLAAYSNRMAALSLGWSPVQIL